MERNHTIINEVLNKVINNSSGISPNARLLISSDLFKLKEILLLLIAYQESIFAKEFENTRDFKHEINDFHKDFNTFTRSWYKSTFDREAQTLTNDKPDFDIDGFRFEFKLTFPKKKKRIDDGLDEAYNLISILYKIIKMSYLLVINI